MLLKYSLLILLAAIYCCGATITTQNPAVDAGLKTLGIGSRLDITISSFEPTWSHLHPVDETRTLITIHGCGFSRELYAVCVFDLSFTSYASRIVDDNTLICELPFLETSSFETLPYWSRLDIYWGDHVSSVSESRLAAYANEQSAGSFPNSPTTRADASFNAMGEMSYVGQFRWGPQLDCAPLNPTFGPTSNGGQVQILGEGFLDNAFAQLTPNVYFDDKLASSVSVISDTLISVTPPSVNELGIDALVSIVWGANFTSHRSATNPTEIYLWSSELYHYGPIFTGVTPTCAKVNGSSILTITGFGFTDPLFQVSPLSPSQQTGGQFSNALLYLTPQNTPTWSSAAIVNHPVNPTMLQVEPLSITASAITFTTPDWLQYSVDQNEMDGNYVTMLNTVVSIDVYWRRTNRLMNQPTNEVTNLQYQNTRLSYRLGPQITSLDHLNWHYGGGDRVCLIGECLDEYALDSALSQGTYSFRYGDGTDVWQSGTVSRSGSMVCGTTANYPPCNSGDTVTFLSNYQFVPSVVSYSNPSVIVGPILNDNQYRVYVTNPINQKITISGVNIGYNLTHLTAWNSIDETSSLLYDSFAVTSDSSLDLAVPNGTFAQTDGFQVNFHANSATCTRGAFTVNWGATCSASSFYNLPLTGTSQISIVGEGFEKYDVQVRLCDITTQYGVANTFTGLNGEQSLCQDISGSSTLLFEETTKQSQSSTSASFQIAGNSETWNEGTAFRGRRLWGQYFQIIAYFNSDVVEPGFASSISSVYPFSFLGSCSEAGSFPCVSKVSIACGKVRFGPVVDGISPCQGPHGPSGQFLTAIDISGSNFEDPWTNDFRPAVGGYTPVNVPRSSNFNLVALGSFIQKPITSVGATLSTQTVGNDYPWMGITDTKYHQVGDIARSGAIGTSEDSVNAIPFRNDALDISVFFDTCNVSLVPDVLIHWGPSFAPCPIQWLYGGATQWQNPNISGTSCDIYGLPAWIPDNAHIQSTPVDLQRGVAMNAAYTVTDKNSEYLSLNVRGVGQYCLTLGAGPGIEGCKESSPIEFLGKCFIDGVETATYLDKSDTALTTDVTILCKIPERPFGTQANVCLRFPDRTSIDDTQLSMGEDFFDPSLAQWRAKAQDFHNYYEICVQDQFVHYKPYIALSAPTSFATSGTTSSSTTAGTFTVDCWGCKAYFESTQIHPSFYVGGVFALSSAPSISGGISTYTVTVPTYHAEFNTDVSVSLQWNDMNQTCTNGYPTAFWKVWTAEKVHFGPECTATPSINNLFGTVGGVFPDGAPLNTLKVQLGVSNGVDCWADDCTGNLNTTQNGLCLFPQPSNRKRVLYSPFDLNGNPSGKGSLVCMHRNYQINLNGPSTHLGVQVQEDSTAPSDVFNFIPPNRTDAQIDCATYSVSIVFTDALVSSESQRTINCPMLSWNNAEKTGDIYTLSHPLTYIVNGFTTFYGWGSDRLSSSGINDDQITVTNAATDLYWQFGSNNYVQHLDLLDGSSAFAASPLGGNIFSVHNSSDFGKVFDIRVSFVNTAGTRKCAVIDSKFHYGPEIISSTHDSETCSVGSVLLAPTNPPFNTITGSVVSINGRGFQCCGYSQTPGNPYGIACSFSNPSSMTSWNNNLTWTPTAVSGDVVSCTIPANNNPEASKYRLAGYGLFFGALKNGQGTAAEFCPLPSGQCSSTGVTTTNVPAQAAYNRFINQATAPANGVMGGICYGPKITPAPIHLRYSGYANRPLMTDNDQVADITLPIIGITGTEILSEYNTINNSQIIAGESYSLNPYFSCSYSGDSGTEITYNNPAISPAPTTFNCRARLFAKQCGDSSDLVSYKFLNVTDFTGQTPGYSYVPGLWTLPPSSSGSFTSEGAALTATVEYGPTFSFSGSSFTSYLLPSDPTITVVSAPQAFNIEIQGSYDSPYRDLVQPGYNTINIIGSYLDDWLGLVPGGSPSSTAFSNWGTHYAACLFGVLSDATPSNLVVPSITFDSTYGLLDPNNPSLLDVPTFSFRSSWDNSFSNLALASLNNGDYGITCPIPGGSFDSWGYVYVLLDPHIDDYTVIYGPSSNLSPMSQNPRNYLTSYWHWTPYVTGAVKPWTASGVSEPIVFTGAGFLNYQTVSCSFGSAISTASIFNDRLVICNVPPYLSPQELTVSLVFGLSEPFIGCMSDVYPSNTGYTSKPSISSLSPFNLFPVPAFNQSLEASCVNSTSSNGYCRTSFDCAGNPNLVEVTNFVIAGVVDFCPKSGPVLGSSEITFQSFGFEFFESVECTFHLSSDDIVVPATLVNSTGALTYACISPSVSTPQSVLVTLSGNYNPSWTSLLGVYSSDLGSFWFDFNLPTLRTVSPLSVLYSEVTSLTITGDYFNGGNTPVAETEGQDNWNYYCMWQVPSDNTSPTLPLDGVLPSFSSFVKTYATPSNYTQENTDCSFTSRFFTCLSPPDLQQFGHYYFSFIYSGVSVSQPIVFSVLARDIQLDSATSAVGFLNASSSIEQFSDAFELILQGSNFLGGRFSNADQLASSICKFNDPLATDSLGPSLSAALIESESSARCFAPHLNIYDQMVSFFNSLSADSLPKSCRNKPIDPPKPKQTSRAECMAKWCSSHSKKNPDLCSPSISFDVALSNTAGYTWSNALPVSYQFRFSSATSLLILPITLVLLAFGFVF